MTGGGGGGEGRVVCLTIFCSASPVVLALLRACGVIIYNKTRQLFFVSVVGQTFLGFEMITNFPRDTSPLRRGQVNDTAHSFSVLYVSLNYKLS